MSLKNIKSNLQAERGFTIVELLIVVVVIAILAAITIVSYNGITNRANASAAASLAASFQKKAELFAADGPTATYPRALNDLTGGAAILNSSPSVTTTASNSWYLAPSSISSTTANPTSTNGKTTIRYNVCGHLGTTTAPTTIAAMTTITGGQIIYYDFEAGGTTVKTITVGTATTGGNPNVACIAS